MDHEWNELFEKLKSRTLPLEEIAAAFVRLGKPFDRKRILGAKDVVASYLDHPDPWVRHEAMWFLTSWGGLSEYGTALIHTLQHDPDVDNRSFAALCLAHLRRKTSDPETVKVLKGAVEDEREDRLVRLSSYGALLEVCKSESGFSFQAYTKELSDIDWDWVRSLS